LKRRWLHSEGRSPVKLPLGASSLTKSYQTAIRLFVPTADHRAFGEGSGSWCLPVAYLSKMCLAGCGPIAAADECLNVRPLSTS